MQQHNFKADLKNHFKDHQKRINEEKEKGRELDLHKTKKVSDERYFKTITNEELFDEKNKHIIDEMFKKLQICNDNKCNNPRCKNLFYLYTNKKVGSTCLWGSINVYLSNIFRTFHYHNIGDLEREQVYGISINQLLTILKKQGKNVIVIDIYRPIFDICVSNYFNELNIHFQRDFNVYPEFENKDTFIHRFLNLFDHYYDKYNVDYFKEEYNLPQNELYNAFDFEKKHFIYVDESIKYIKLRLCDSSEWSTILEPYLGYKINIIKYNETKTKSWGKFYEYFNENFFITTNMYDKIKNNTQFKMYYTEEEQINYLKKFENRIKDDKIFGFQDKELMFYYNIIHKNEVKEILSHLSLESNSPISLNCPCNICNNERINIINAQTNKMQENSINTLHLDNTQIQSNINNLQVKNTNRKNKGLGYMNFSK